MGDNHNKYNNNNELGTVQLMKIEQLIFWFHGTNLHGYVIKNLGYNGLAQAKECLRMYVVAKPERYKLRYLERF